MIYLEMARDEAHGGGTWAFTNCIWAPIAKRGGGTWPYWSKIPRVREGDTVIHLRGVPPQARFIGYSIASADGFETSRRPPNPGRWDYSEKFYRADLSDFTPFHQPVNLSELFLCRRSELENYFDRNKMRGGRKANIFFVRQAGRLQCLNGAYLSDVDDELLTAMFGLEGSVIADSTENTVVSVETGSQIATVRTRLGQARFSEEIKKLYNHKCCFPSCNVSDPRFLVGAHIARWSDNEKLRGALGNGLCFCLLHDKAFEIGLFTLDEEFRIFVNPNEKRTKSPIVANLMSRQGQQISLANVKPLDDALLEHWIRVDIQP
jgi:putative restriction endonuclease